MNRYELTYIIDTGLEESARKELMEKISQLIAANGGEVEKVDETWGKRRLAYAINYKTEGWYVLLTLKGPAALPREIARNLGNMEAILRHLFVRLEEKCAGVKPRPIRLANAVAVPAETEPADAEPAQAQPAAEPAEKAAEAAPAESASHAETPADTASADAVSTDAAPADAE